MGSFFSFGQGVPKKGFLKGFFCNFLGINTYNFVKNDSKFENKGLFHAKFYGA